MMPLAETAGTPIGLHKTLPRLPAPPTLATIHTNAVGCQPLIAKA